MYVFMLIICASFVQAGVVFSDDFSGDLSQWTVIVDPNPYVSGFPDEYGVQNGVFHTAQLSPAEKGLYLYPNFIIQEGDVLEYDIIYTSGAGNRLSRLIINDIPLSIRMRDIDNYPCYQNTCYLAGSGQIGYWNDEPELGNEYGTYHVTLEFNSDTIDIEFIKPNGSVWTHTTTQVYPPFEFAISSRTGHNGMFHLDYDNYVIQRDVSDIPEFGVVGVFAVIVGLIFRRKCIKK